MIEAKLVHELDARIRAAAVAAYEAVHGFAPAMDFAPDRAWLEGYSAALAQPQEAEPSQDAERWQTLRDSKLQLGFSWLGVPFIGFEMSGSANKAWVDAMKKGLALDAAIDAARTQAKEGKQP